jgi:hypothetical protein
MSNNPHNAHHELDNARTPSYNETDLSPSQEYTEVVIGDSELQVIEIYSDVARATGVTTATDDSTLTYAEPYQTLKTETSVTYAVPHHHKESIYTMPNKEVD